MQLIGHLNLFRLIGDFLHASAIIILLLKICKTHSCTSISGKSQLLLALVYLTRYVDVFTRFISWYNTSMKLYYIIASFLTLYLIFFKFNGTYQREHDAFRLDFLLLPCVLLALFVNYEFKYMELLWTFSIYLEAVTLIPQFFMIYRTCEWASIRCYLFAFGSYRLFYILNWAYRYYTQQYYDAISIVGGVVQTVIFAAFLIIYVLHIKTFQGQPSEKSPPAQKDIERLTVSQGLPETNNIGNPRYGITPIHGAVGSHYYAANLQNYTLLNEENSTIINSKPKV